MSRLKSRQTAQDESSGSVFDENQSSTGVAVDGSALSSSNMTPSFSSPEKTPSERTRRPTVEPPLLKGRLVWRYIGVKTRSEAEEAVKPPTEFRLYHQWEQTDGWDENVRLPLTVIYRSSRNTPFHWLVRTMGELVEDEESKQKEFVIRGYYIEHGGPMFPNLSTLVQFYENHSYNRNGYIDVFTVPHH